MSKDKTVKTAYVINPKADFNQLLYTMLADLEIPHVSPEMKKSALLDIFYEFLLNELELDTHVVLIFDEAQNLSVSALGDIRLLHGEPNRARPNARSPERHGSGGLATVRDATGA